MDQSRVATWMTVGVALLQELITPMCTIPMKISQDVLVWLPIS